VKPKVCLTVIAAAATNKEAAQLEKMLTSVKGHVDAIYVQLNAPKGKLINPEMRRVAETLADKIFTYEWNDSFVAARNDLMKKVPKKYDWIMWADADDIIDNPENIQPSLAVMPDKVNGVYILYDYQKDEFGNVIVSHWVTRAVRNNDSFAWKSSFDDDEVSVHETLIAKRSGDAVANNEWKVVHNTSPGHFKESLLRNIELLEGMAKRQATTEKGIDPRILFYLGSHYNEAYRFTEALELFIEYLKVSGWAEERAEAHIFIGRILKNKGKTTQARNAFLQAMGENPKNPGAYLELGKLEAKSQRWERAAEWLRQGVEKKTPISPMVRYSYDFELLTNYAQALSNLGGKNLSEALKMAQEALVLRPYDADAKANRDTLEQLIRHRNNIRATSNLLKELTSNEEDSKIIPFLDALPANLQDSPAVVSARQHFAPAKKWPPKSIALYVGQGALGSWGPWSLETGIGGSEEAVIRLSRELIQLGWGVTVYATPGTRAGVYDGVEWKHYWEFNAKDSFDVLISWRQAGFFDVKWDAHQTYLWLHDISEKEELIPERLKNITKVIYVSKYHSERPESAHITPSKKLPSGNGIDPTEFMKYDGKFKRDPHRCIYMSANERGLRVLYDIWPEVRKAVPDATLDTYYGWQSFDAINHDNPERMAWKASMQARLKELKGITDHGRIGHGELNQEIFKSGVWAYPSFFPEVNCITAQKAMAGGAWPVTSNFAALGEVVKRGDVLDMHDFSAEDVAAYTKALIYRLKHPPTEKERQEMMSWARETFNWSVTAQQWSAEFNKKG
jgi:tetratricopeptide (TPR) repeat protein